MRAHEAGALHGDLGTRGPAWLRAPEDVNTLVPHLWPRTVTRAAAGDLTVGGMSVRALAAEYGTPAYVLDEEDLRARCRDFAAAFAGADVYYAGKAFLCRAVVRIIAEEGLFLDVCTGGELADGAARGLPAGSGSASTATTSPPRSWSGPVDAGRRPDRRRLRTTRSIRLSPT
jgi:diaminopimelate decarboxylase